MQSNLGFFVGTRTQTRSIDNPLYRKSVLFYIRRASLGIVPPSRRYSAYHNGVGSLYKDTMWFLFCRVASYILLIILLFNLRYYTREDAENALRYVNGTRLDDRVIRCDWDAGFREGRQFGRGKHGGQVRDEYRQNFDSGRGGWNKTIQVNKNLLKLVIINPTLVYKFINHFIFRNAMIRFNRESQDSDLFKWILSNILNHS